MTTETLTARSGTAKDLLKQIPKRLIEVVIKLLSFRTVVLVAATVLVMKGYLQDYTFLVLAVVAIFGRDALKIIGELKK